MRPSHLFRRLCILACALALLIAGLGDARAEEPPRRLPGSWVLDRTSTLDADATREVAELSTALWREHRARLAVVLVPDVAPYSLEDFAGRTFRAWGLGEETRNRGVLLLVAVGVRRNRIEVSTNLGATFSAHTANEILTKVFRPTARADGAREATLATSRAIVQQFREGRYDTSGPVTRFAAFLFFTFVLMGLIAWLSKGAVTLLLYDADDDLHRAIWVVITLLCAVYALPLMSAIWLHVPDARDPVFHHHWLVLAGLLGGSLTIAVAYGHLQRFVLGLWLDRVGVEALAASARAVVETGVLDELPFAQERLDDATKRDKEQRRRVRGYRWPVWWVLQQLREEVDALRGAIKAARDESPAAASREVAAQRADFDRLTEAYIALAGSPPTVAVSSDSGAPFRAGAHMVDPLAARFAEADAEIAAGRPGDAIKRARELTEKRRAELAARQKLEALVDGAFERRDQAVKALNACAESLPRARTRWNALRTSAPRPHWADLVEGFETLSARMQTLQADARAFRTSPRPQDREDLSAFEARLFDFESRTHAVSELVAAVEVRPDEVRRATVTIAKLRSRCAAASVREALRQAEGVKAVSTPREHCERCLNEVERRGRELDPDYSLTRHAAVLTTAVAAIDALDRALRAALEAERKAAEAAQRAAESATSSSYDSSSGSSYASSSDCTSYSSDCSRSDCSSDCSSSTGSSSDW